MSAGNKVNNFWICQRSAGNRKSRRGSNFTRGLRTPDVLQCRSILTKIIHVFKLNKRKENLKITHKKAHQFQGTTILKFELMNKFLTFSFNSVVSSFSSLSRHFIFRFRALCREFVLEPFSPSSFFLFSRSTSSC